MRKRECSLVYQPYGSVLVESAPDVVILLKVIEYIDISEDTEYI